MGKIHLVTCAGGAEQALHQVMSRESVIGLACTGANVGPKGVLSLVLVSTMDGDVFAFDVKKNPDLMYLGIGRLLQSVHLLKVVHDCASFAANLHYQFGISLENIFDTQVAYSVVLEDQGLCRRRLPLMALCDKCNIRQYKPSQQFQKLLAEDMNVWLRRPLTREMLNTAATMALPLVPGLFSHLMKAMNSKSWDWFTVLNDENRLSQMNGRHKSQQRQQQESERAKHQELPILHLSAMQKILLKGTLPPAVPL